MTDPEPSANGSKQAQVFFGQTRGQWLFLFACVLGGVVGIAWLGRSNETAREVLSSAGWAAFTFFTTPFILEVSVALLGLCLVIAWNNRRIEREGDDWVVMEVPDETDKDKEPSDRT